MQQHIFEFKGSIKTNKQGYEVLINFHTFVNNFEQTNILLDFTKLKWIDANMCANILAYCRLLEKENNITFSIDKDLYPADDILWRNNFFHLLTYSTEKTIDIRNSTIPLIELNSKDINEFVEYIDLFLSHRSLKHITNDDKQNIKNNYLELFDNIDTHANSSLGCFICGQMFPTKKITNFTMTDCGDGFLKKIKATTEKTESPINTDKEAIIWALKNNTTKIGEPGGKGLTGVLHYCNHSNSSLQIFSGEAFIEIAEGKGNIYTLPNQIKGSTVNLLVKY